MLDLDTALEHLYALLDQSSPETVSIADARGRYLSAPVFARMTQPPFDASAMDGYALRSADGHSGSVLEMIGTSQAGAGFAGVVLPGQCVRIFTGAPVPETCDTVIMQEETAADGQSVTLTADSAPGANVRKAGNDFANGHALLAPGKALSPADIALLAAANVAQVDVIRRPRIALIATGDELVQPGTMPGPDQIIASNSVALSALLSPFAEIVTDFGIVGDSEEAITAALNEALSGAFDLVVTTGGASVGDHDLVQPVLKSLGVEIDFWKIAMRPGKPLMAGKKERTLVVGLPGNPVSALVTAHVVVLPLIRKMMGAKSPCGPQLSLPLSEPLGANGIRRHFRRAHIVEGVDGRTEVRPEPQTDSAHLSSLAESDALIVQMENSAALPAGAIVACLLLNPTV